MSGIARTFMGMDLSWTGSALVTVDIDTLGGICLAGRELLNRGSKTRFKGKALLGIDNLAYVAEGIRAELEARRPDLVALEDYSGGRGPNPFVLALTGEVTGAAKLAMRELGIPWIEVAATTLKKYVTGKGSGKKHVVLEGCYKRFGVGSAELGDDDNVIDAYVLARFAHGYARTQAGLYTPLKYEAEAFAKARIGGSDRASKANRRAA